MFRHFLFIIFCLVSFIGFGQKIKTKEIDKYTKAETIESSLETLYSVNFMGSGWCNKFEFCIRRINGEYAMPANILMNEIVKYTENDGIFLLLEDNSTIFLKTSYTGVGGEAFANGYWFNTSFRLSPTDVEKLKNHKVTSIRIKFMGGHYDRDLKKNKQELIMKSLKLFDSL